MPEETRISPVAVIGIGLGLGLAAAVGVFAVAQAAAPTRPPPSPGRANLYGKVTNSGTGEVISGVLVTLDGMQIYTDSGGNYAFDDLDPGEYILQFSKEGYETAIY